MPTSAVNCYCGFMRNGMRSLAVALEAAPGAREAALVDGLRAGSEEAFAYLLATYQNPLYNLIAYVLGADGDAGDVLQDVFVKVFRGVRQFHGQSSLKTWIYRIAIHEVSNNRRGRYRRKAHEPVSLEQGHEDGSVAEPPARDATPYQALELAERQAILRRALANVPEPYRTVLILRAMDDFSYSEIAQVLSIAEGTVKSRLMRGRELLRRKLANSIAR